MRITAAFIWIAALGCFATIVPARVSQEMSDRAGHPGNPRPVAKSDSDQALRTFRTLHIRSDTVYLKSEVVCAALEQQPEFSAWGLAIVGNREEADVSIEITRPFMTFDWKYDLVHQKTGMGLCSGKVVAWDGTTAAKKLAADIMKRIEAVRPLPASAQDEGQARPSKRKGSLRSRQWSVRAVQDGTQLNLIVYQNSIIVQAKGAVLFSIPAQDVISIAHSTEIIGKNMAEPWWDFWGIEGGELFWFIALPVGLALEGIDEMGKHKDHFVRIDWMENGSVRGSTFSVDSLEYTSLMAELQNVTKKSWEDLPKWITKAKEDLMREMPRNVSLDLDRKAWVGHVELEPRSYRLVLIERFENGHRAGGELYVFPADLMTVREVRAVVIVDVDWQEELPQKTASISEFKDENGIISISKIRMPNRLITIRGVPLDGPR